MSIRKTLLLTILLAALLPVTIVTALSYRSSRQALENAIKASLLRDAELLMQRIDTSLFERLENLRGWSHLEVMQDAAIGDVDKRLAHFLVETKASYGRVYQALYFLAMDQSLLASSRLPQPHGEKLPARDFWQKIASPRGDVEIDRLSSTQSGHPATVLPLSTTVNNRFTGKPLGRLVALVDWNEVKAMLGNAQRPGSTDKQRLALLLNETGHIIAGTSAWGTPADAPLALEMPKRRNGTFVSRKMDAAGATWLIGYARSSGYQHFPGLGWRVLISEPVFVAFAPVRRLLLGTLAVLVLTSLVAIILANTIAGRIAGPITRLAAFTRSFKQDQRLLPHRPEGSTETRSLNRAFREMIESLTTSRQQLIQAGKLATVGEMAATMAHEIRTPLGILRSSAQLLARQPGLGAQGEEMIDFILGESERLNGLVTRLLDCGRPQPPVLIGMDVQHSIRSVVEMLAGRAAHKHITIQTEAFDPPAMIEGDPEQMKQVFLNLILNAIQILPDGGTIGLKTSVCQQTIQMDVYDDGHGIALQDRGRVFDPFFSTRDGGFGLGLSVVQQIVQLHGGSIKVMDSPLGGACFRIHIPSKR